MLHLDAPKTGESRYLLLDGAQCAGIPSSMLPTMWVERATPLFDGLLPDGCRDVAPYLARLRNASDAPKVHAALSRHLTHPGAVTWLDTSLAHDELQARLLRRLHTSLSNGKRMLLRIYDGRVLPHFFNVLDPEQQSRFFSIASRWWYFSPQLEWRWIEGNVTASDPLREDLAMTREQRGQLQDACYPYSLLDHFVDTAPELLDNIPPNERYEFFRDSVAAAERMGLSAASDFVLFCTLALLEGKNFHASEAWRERMGEIASGQKSLRSVFEEHYRQVEME